MSKVRQSYTEMVRAAKEINSMSAPRVPYHEMTDAQRRASDIVSMFNRRDPELVKIMESEEPFTEPKYWSYAVNWTASFVLEEIKDFETQPEQKLARLINNPVEMAVAQVVHSAAVEVRSRFFAWWDDGEIETMPPWSLSDDGADYLMAALDNLVWLTGMIVNGVLINSKFYDWVVFSDDYPEGGCDGEVRCQWLWALAVETFGLYDRIMVPEIDRGADGEERRYEWAALNIEDPDYWRDVVTDMKAGK